MTIAALARPEIRALRAYEAAASPDDAIRLNANEAPLAIESGTAKGLNRYPAIRPAALTATMAAHYGVAPENILVTRGSSEGIDLLIRSFCTAGQDSVLLTPPTFELYEIYASVQGARCIKVPLEERRDFAVDSGALLSACDDRTKLIFLCSPNNPVGTLTPREEILHILQSRSGKSVVVVDEAYNEYSGVDSLAPLVRRFDNLVVLRTLSKGLALAGARCGAVVASAGLIRLLDAILAPYALSSPVIASAEQALTAARLAAARELINGITAERERLHVELAACKAVRRIWPSRANFLLVRFTKLKLVAHHLANAGIVIRTFDGEPALEDCARITVASAADNDRLIRAIRGFDRDA